MNSRRYGTREVPFNITAHWCQRVRERIGEGVCPVDLARGILWAVDHGRDDLVVYLGRLSRGGLRAFRFRVPDGRYFAALVDMDHRSTITVLTAGRPVRLARGRLAWIEPGGPAP